MVIGYLDIFVFEEFVLALRPVVDGGDCVLQADSGIVVSDEIYRGQYFKCLTSAFAVRRLPFVNRIMDKSIFCECLLNCRNISILEYDSHCISLWDSELFRSCAKITFFGSNIHVLSNPSTVSAPPLFEQVGRPNISEMIG